ncbi:MAG: methyltransferase domain-containing protein [Lachnospiraceae bacterium]|nr:methyltransferase domain-containing protein [Lachnospiraceae bacterium]
MEVFQDYSYYYNLFYRDKDYKKEAEQIDFLLKEYGNNVKTIISFGCGTGKHDIELLKMGYCMEGIDASKTMLDIAKKNFKENNIEEKVEIADIRFFEAHKYYDAVISLFHVISYQNSNEDVLKSFRSARKALKNGGIFLFDVWYGPGVLTDLPIVRVKEVEDKERRLIRIAQPLLHDKTNVVDVCYEILISDKNTNITKNIKETHSMRYFFRPELEMLLAETGFELIDNLDCNTLKETNYNSWTSYFIAKAV